MTVRHIAVDVLLWLGVVLTLIGCLGVVLMRTVYDRLHFSAPPVLGAACIAAAVVVQKSFSLVGDKSILIAVLLIVLSPILTHATGRAARLVERGDWRVTDEEVRGR
ncbi:MAG TPA: monovalent cation/H(+) antiporter subunit G [Solirubrobacteraceae bacterium]|nr:monovalent cation/H(+) antiporter subunit G [Solirubrobacteraceae bacterium]